MKETHGQDALAAALCLRSSIEVLDFKVALGKSAFTLSAKRRHRGFLRSYSWPAQ